MKLIKWNLHEDVEAYTTTRKLGDISLNNPNYLKVLENRQELASLLNTDLEHMVAPRQTHSTNLKQVFLMKDGGTNMLKQTDDLYEVDATYTKDKDLFLLSFHADCTPILVYCKDQKSFVLFIQDGLVQLEKLLIIQFVILLKKKIVIQKKCIV